jgi:hypothetical protein
MLYKVLIFESTHAVMKAEKCLLGITRTLSVIPTPKEFSSDCGIAIRIEATAFDEKTIHQILCVESIPYRIFEKEML